MKRNSYSKRRTAASAKLFFAALCLALCGGAASLFPPGSTQEASWRFHFDSFALFSSSAENDERPRCYLDASGRRVDCAETVAPLSEESATIVAESTEILSNDDSPLESENPVGATFDEAEPELAPVSFATDDQTSAPNFENAGWFVDKHAQERDQWSRELRLEAFPELTFAESSLPTWDDSVAIAPATSEELSALAFDPNVGSSSLVSPSLRSRAASAQLLSGDHVIANTANAPQTPNAAPQTPSVAPTRVGAFTACGAFDAYGSAKVRVQ